MSNLSGTIFRDMVATDSADPVSVAEYEKTGGFEALKKAVKMTGEDIIAEVKKAKLIGRRGEAHSFGNRLEHILNIPETPKYIACNASEDEPGTFTDRFLLGRLPLKLVEGIAIAGFALKAKASYVYVRGEYRKLQKQLIKAIENARNAGFLGKNILGTGFDFDIHVNSGAGAYVCGEDTAVLNSIEGKVGRPRIKQPPHLEGGGGFLKPALINNVESFVQIPTIIGMGGDEFLKTGHPDSGGTKLVCLSGHVRNRGLFEVPLGGLTLREIIYDDELGGGIAGGKDMKFFHLGGQSGPIGGSDLLDTVYSYTDLKKAGLSVGSGAVVVMDETVSVIDYVKCVVEFFANESCGKCVPCREGTRHILDILDRLSILGAAGSDDLETLRRLIRTMTVAAFCGLGTMAVSALNSAWRHFKAEFEANVQVGEKT